MAKLQKDLRDREDLSEAEEGRGSLAEPRSALNRASFRKIAIVLLIGSASWASKLGSLHFCFLSVEYCEQTSHNGKLKQADGFPVLRKVLLTYPTPLLVY